MTDSKQIITPKARLLLDALHSKAGCWLNRSKLASMVNKRRLNDNDVRQLNDMAEWDLIERRKVPIVSPIGYQWQYRIIPKQE